ncbi:MAG: hypothetical protein ABIO70_37020 [Pseudomonadota bacterium]
MTLALLLTLLLVACGEPPPARVEDCPSLRTPAARDACLLEWLPARFRDDPEGADRTAMEAFTDPLARDMLYLTVSREIDPHGGLWCERIAAVVLADRCRTLARRPHLQRGASSSTP